MGKKTYWLGFGTDLDWEFQQEMKKAGVPVKTVDYQVMSYDYDGLSVMAEIKINLTDEQAAKMAEFDLELAPEGEELESVQPSPVEAAVDKLVGKEE